jgi:hypothetical protein
MAYLHIENLYKARDIMLFRECYAMEKIHGTSAKQNTRCLQESREYLFITATVLNR